MNTAADDEIALAQRIAAGDEAALAAFYERYADPLFAFIYHHVDERRTDAEELWQETLLAALHALPTYRGQAALFSWLCSIARHKIADYGRRRGHNAAELFSDLPEGLLAELTATTPLPEEVVMHKATRAHVIEALGTLTEDYRKALVARYAEEYSVDETARLLGRTYKATESLLARARTALREALTRLEEAR